MHLQFHRNGIVTTVRRHISGHGSFLHDSASRDEGGAAILNDWYRWIVTESRRRLVYFTWGE
jgi:hypothetical protein